MKHALITLLCASILLTSCRTQTAKGPSADRATLLANPLYAEQYYDDLVGQMVELFIRKDPITEGEKRELLEETRTEALTKAKEAARTQQEGKIGTFVSAKAHTQGEVLLLGGQLYTGPEFIAFPGKSLHVYLSTLQDPRDEAFPEAEAIDLGELPTPYGAQAISVPVLEHESTYLSVALWDSELELLYGFAQLQ